MESAKLIVPFIIAAIIAFIVSAIYLINGLKDHQKSKSSYKLFQQLVYELSKTTALANELSIIYAQIKNEKLLEMYESALRMLENILTTSREIHPFEGQIKDIQTAIFMTRENKNRFEMTKRAFKRDLKGKDVELGGKALKNLTDIPTGCYFCSRPFEFVTFKVVKVKIEKKKLEKYACAVCRKQLRAQKKVKVLHFLNDGKPVHWSEMPGYEPQKNYYSLNKNFPEHKKPLLALVYSKKDDNN